MRTVIVSAEDFIAGRALDVMRAAVRPHLTSVKTPSSVTVMTPSKGTARRSIRVTDDLWNAVTAAAERRDESVSDVIRRAMESYAKEDERDRIRASRCPLCKALPGDPCTWPDGTAVTWFHPLRHQEANR